MPKRRAPPPAEPGLALQHLKEVYSSAPPEREDLKIGHVLLLFCDHDKSVAKTIYALCELLPATCTTANLMKPIVKTFESYRSLRREKEKLKFVNYCNEPFTAFLTPKQQEPEERTSERQDFVAVQHETIEPDPSPQQTPGPSGVPGPSSDIVEVQVKTIEPCPTSQQTTGPSSVPGLSPDSVRGSSSRLRGGNLTPHKLKLKRRIDFVSNRSSTEKKRYQKRIKKLQEKVNTQKVNRIKYLNQDIKRKQNLMKQKDAHIVLLLKRVKELEKLQQKPALQQKPNQSEETITNLNRIHKRLKQSNKTKRKKVTTEFVSKKQYMKVKNELEAKDEMNTQYENQVCELQEKLAEIEKDENEKEKETKLDGKTYSTGTRMKVFDHIINQVPTQNVPTLIQSSAKRRGETLTSIPHRTTVEQMTRELASIADLQSAELVMKTENLTIGFDATTQEGVHINSIHVTTQHDCNVIAVDELPGGTADDYFNHITSSVDYLAETYSDFHQEDYQYCRSKIISNITNTMNDRVAVNHATIKQVDECWGKTLNELNCHLHPLDTIASSCRSSLKSLETTKGDLFGKDCVAANIVLQVNKLRYKDGKGDPKGFKIFLKDNDMPMGIIPRYRGNRFHVIFHICGKLVEHHKLFLNFFSSGACSCGGLVAGIVKDFQSETGMLEMHVLGLLGKLLTGPWMQLFYTSSQDSMSHIDGIEMVRGVLSTLKQAATSPRDTWVRTTDFFGRQLGEDPTLKALQAEPADIDSFEKMMSSCLLAIIGVLERQYKRYFQLEITEELQRETMSARMHNIDAEEIMGTFSANKERAKNANVDFITARMRARKNNVVPWLDDRYQEKRASIVTWAVGRARKRRRVNRMKDSELKKEMSRRAANKRQKKSQKERKDIEKRLKETDTSNLKAVFPDLSADMHSLLTDILTGTIVGRKICHSWYDEDTTSKTLYYGKVEKLKIRKGNIFCYKIGYWSGDETYEDATDYDIPKLALAADLICEDLIVC